MTRSAAGQQTMLPQHAVFGLRCWRGLPRVMAGAHRHDDIEVNITEAGEVDYSFGGELFRVPSGSALIFWAAIPHQLLACSESASMFWITVPLALAVSRGLPESLLRRLLQARHVVAKVDRDMSGSFIRWERELGGSVPQLKLASILELDAWLRRITYDIESSTSDRTEEKEDRSLARVGTMAEFIAARFREPIRIQDVAAAAHVSKPYAMALFREIVGTTINEHLTGYRVAEARRLLLTTNAPVSQIAFASGFGSLGQFYTAFRAICHEPPAEYRRNGASSWDSTASS